MFQWFPEDPPGIDVEKCREEWGLMTWEEWIEKESAWKNGCSLQPEVITGVRT